MTNTINSQNQNIDNILAARKLSKKDQSKRAAIYVEAPQYLPKYSITQKMEEQDTFRKAVLDKNYKQNYKKNGFKKFLTVVAAVGATIIGYKFYCKM